MEHIFIKVYVLLIVRLRSMEEQLYYMIKMEPSTVTNVYGEALFAELTIQHLQTVAVPSVLIPIPPQYWFLVSSRNQYVIHHVLLFSPRQKHSPVSPVQRTVSDVL